MSKRILSSMFCSILFLSFTIIQATNFSDLFFLPSGRHVPINAVRRFYSRVRFQDLPHILFEVDKNNSICSHYACLNMRELAPENHVIVRETNFRSELRHLNNRQFPRSTNVHYGNAYTFAIDSLSSSLVTAWGPATHLHPLSSAHYPGVFLNAAVLNSPTVRPSKSTVMDRVSLAIFHASQKFVVHNKTDHSATHTSIKKTCKRVYTLELAIQYDKTFCALYDDDHDLVISGLGALENQISRLFLKSACVRVSFARMIGDCKNDPFASQKSAPPTQAQCSGHGSCDFSKSMLQFISKNTLGTFGFVPDGTFLFTGYSDHSSLGGGNLSWFCLQYGIFLCMGYEKLCHCPWS